MNTKRFIEDTFGTKFRYNGSRTVVVDIRSITDIIKTLSYYLDISIEDYTIQQLNDNTINTPPNKYANIKMICYNDNDCIMHNIPILYDRDDQILLIREIRNIINIMKMIRHNGGNSIIEFNGGFKY